MTAPTSFIRPFIAARDYELSKAFYKALGFRVDFESPEVTGFSNDSGSFMLQNYYVEEWAHNTMLTWGVDNLDAWFTNIQQLDLPGRFGVRPPSAPALQPWGKVVSHLIDPAGVLWHVSQKPSDE